MSELLDTAIEQEINQEIFETAQRLFGQLEKELNSPDTRKLYLTGERDIAVRTFSDPLIEAIALRIIEKEELIRCSLDQASIDHLREELFFYIDLFYAVVTTVIEIAVIRKKDISDSEHLLFLFATMQVVMSRMIAIAELENLRKVLRDLADDYPSKPELQKRIALLVPAQPTQSSVYLVNPPKAIREYENGNVLGSISEPGLTATGIAGLPAGIVLDELTGEISVQDPGLLVKGVYTLFVKTTDAEGGLTDNEVKLPVGTDNAAIYTVFPPKKVTAYSSNEVLATVSDPDGEIVSAKINTDDAVAAQATPPGVALNPTSGALLVSNRNQLVAGIYYLSITTTDNKGGKTRHAVLLVFEVDHDAIYKVSAPKGIKSYRNDEVLATVTDADGGVSGAVLTGLPPGVAMDSATGDLTVQDETLLEEGTYHFNIQTTDGLGLPKINTIKLIIGNNVASYYYIVEPSKKVQGYENGDVLATLNSSTPELEFVTTLSGSLPPGSSLNPSNGTISVTNKNLLQPGITELKILVKPLNGESKAHDLFFEIDRDYKAVYRVKYGKELEGYEAGEVIAEVVDCDVVQAAQLVPGLTMPPGTGLDAETGVITVTDPGSLVAGKYVLLVTTTDVLDGVTESRITLYFTGADNEAIYTVAEPKAIDGYKENDIVAFVTDKDLGVVNAVVSKGGLPSGVSLDPSNGNLFVSDPAKLRSGTFGNLFIKTIDGVGRSTESELTINFLDDLVITYELADPKVITAYLTGDVLVTIIAGTGHVVSVVLTEGKLPTGTILNTITGIISITDPENLIAGEYPLTLVVTDINGGKTALAFEIILLDDQPAVWTVIPPTPVGQLTDGQIIAYPADPNGPVIRATITAGSVPEGINFDTFSGTFVVTTVMVIKAGFYKFIVETLDIQGGITVAGIAFVITDNDSDAIYTVEDPRNVDDYVNDEILAYPEDPDGAIIAAEVRTGEIPPGCVLETNGTIRISNITTFEAGTFISEIRTTDVNDDTTDNVVIIEIIHDTEAVYVIAPAPNYDLISTGMLLAAVSDPDAAIVSARLTMGKLMAGIRLYQTLEEALRDRKNVGDIVVANPELVIPGIYTNIHILTVDDEGGKTSFNLTLEIKPDNETIYKIQFARDVHSYRNNDIIAYPVDFDGAITSAILKGGALHSGVALNTSNGNISIADRRRLIGGFKYPEIVTVDASGGKTKQEIGLDIKINPDRTNRQIRREFIRRFPDRVDEFEVLYSNRLDAAFTENRAFVDGTKATATTINTELANITTENSYWSGSKDEDTKTRILALTDPLAAGILAAVDAVAAAGTPQERAGATADLLLRTGLYAEIFESMLDLASFRNNDIPISPTSSMQTMFDSLDTQLNTVRTLPEVQFLFENITVIRNANPVGHNRLYERLTDLLTLG
jgi:large repetitive protein